MVEPKVAQALAQWAIENYMYQCKAEDIEEVFDAANLMVAMAMNLVETLAERDTLLIYKKFEKDNTH